MEFFLCSGSRQDFREFTVLLETLDEFRYQDEL